MNREELTALLEGCTDLIEQRERLLRHRARLLEERILLLEQRKGLFLRLQAYVEAVKRFLLSGSDASRG